MMKQTIVHKLNHTFEQCHVIIPIMALLAITAVAAGLLFLYVASPVAHESDMANTTDVTTNDSLAESSAHIIECPECNCLECNYDCVVGLRQPTMHELEDFLNISEVNLKEINDTYKCADYSNDLLKELYNEGIQASFVTIYYTDGRGLAHALVAVNTTKGVYYVEPQDDVIKTRMDLLWEYSNMKYMTSSFSHYIPPEYSCVFRKGIKRCHEREI